ncbi:MAG: hypothetical protein IKZ72_02415, partial [Bacteroidales bacterium]|nr:hypothetical protein [Bacteroidales bacterium]
VGLYTSPHILDFRERMRILDGASGYPVRLISKEAVWDFISKWEDDFKRLNLSFFEITTGMAFRWFADERVDIAVIEVGLGGRLDSTNIITPEVAVVTSIGLDHCAPLGDTRAAIAGEKAGIFKPGVPAVVGTRDAETAHVFEAAASAAPCPLIYADAGQECCSASSSAFAKCSAIPLSSDSSKTSAEYCAVFEPGAGSEKLLARAEIQAFRTLYLGERIEQLLKEMDLQGEWQADNLRTALTVLEVLGVEPSEEVLQAIAHTAQRMDFHGRWEMLRRDPDMLCDIGHNPPALARNFAQLEEYLGTGRYDRLIVVYGVMADKDLDGIMPLMPQEATYIVVAPNTPRAMKADVLFARLSSAFPGKVLFGGSVAKGIDLAFGLAVDPSAAICYSALKRHADPFRANAAEGPQPIPDGNKPLIYIGGSTFVVSEGIVSLFHK